MAATILSKGNCDDNRWAKEVFTVLFDVAATATITPTYITQIYAVDITPMSAASAGEIDATYLSGFVPGADTVTIVGVNTTTMLVTLHGVIGS